MTEYPRISQGLGELTPELWNRLMVALKYIEGALDLSEQDALVNLVDDVVEPKTSFLAVITGFTEIATNRFQYDWNEISPQLDSGGLSSSTPSGKPLTSTDVGKAYNLCELYNTSTLVGSGVDVGDDNYPSGFDMMPIGNCGNLSGGSNVSVGVIMNLVRDIKGKVVPVFSMTNAHDGDCS